MDESQRPKNQTGEALKDLSRAIELFKDIYDSSQRRYDSLMREMRGEHQKEAKSQRRDAWLIALLGILGIGLSVIAASYWSYQEKKVELQRTTMEQLYDQVTQKQDQIKDFFTRRDQLMDAMTKLRGVRDEGQRLCKNGIYSGPDPIGYRQRLLASAFELVGAFYKTTGVFDDNIKNKILNFTSLADVDKLDICIKGAVTDLELRKLQAEINTLMLNSIEDLEKQKSDIFKPIKNYKSMNISIKKRPS